MLQHDVPEERANAIISKIKEARTKLEEWRARHKGKRGRPTKSEATKKTRWEGELADAYQGYLPGERPRASDLLTSDMISSLSSEQHVRIGAPRGRKRGFREISESLTGTSGRLHLCFRRQHVIIIQFRTPKRDIKLLFISCISCFEFYRLVNSFDHLVDEQKTQIQQRKERALYILKTNTRYSP